MTSGEASSVPSTYDYTALVGLLASYADSSSVTILFSIGGVSGPPIASFAMTVLTPAGLFVFDCLTSIALAFAAIRVRAAAKEVG